MATYKIFHGDEKPLTAVGEHQCRLLAFADRYPGWNTYAKDRATLRAIEGLKRRGSILTNENRQFCIPYYKDR
jgi:hypothetical protein